MTIAENNWVHCDRFTVSFSYNRSLLSNKGFFVYNSVIVKSFILSVFLYFRYIAFDKGDSETQYKILNYIASLCRIEIRLVVSNLKWSEQQRAQTLIEFRSSPSGRSSVRQFTLPGLSSLTRYLRSSVRYTISTRDVYHE